MNRTYFVVLFLTAQQRLYNYIDTIAFVSVSLTQDGFNQECFAVFILVYAAPYLSWDYENFEKSDAAILVTKRYLYRFKIKS